MRNGPNFGSKQLAALAVQPRHSANEFLFKVPAVEAQLAAEQNFLAEFGRREAQRELEAIGVDAIDYDLYAVRRSKAQGAEIFGPKSIAVGRYSAEMLYGISGSPILRFRSAIQALLPRARKIVNLGADDVEYSYETGLLWTEIGKLKEFISASPAVTELVAELRTARFQFLGKDTPVATVKALSLALAAINEATRLDTTLVDRVVVLLEEGGVDPIAPDSLRSHG